MFSRKGIEGFIDLQNLPEIVSMNKIERYSAEMCRFKANDRLCFAVRL